MAFGSILEGPDPTKLKPLVEQAMPMLIETMKDSSVVVKVFIFSELKGGGNSVTLHTIYQQFYFGC